MESLKISFKLIRLFLFCFILFFGGIKTAQAVVPPDFIVNAGVQTAHIFAIIFFGIAAFLGVFVRFIKIQWCSLWSKKIYNIIFFSGLGVFILGGLIFVSWNLSMAYEDYKLKAEIKIWLAEHQNYLDSFDQNKDQVADYTFFQEHKDLDASISHEKFEEVLESDNDEYIIIDARENIEYASQGYFPDSIRMRLADIRSGSWYDIPSDKLVYVVCARSFRGQVIVDFLRTKNIPARYLSEGIKGWIAYQGALRRNEKLVSKYSLMDSLEILSTDAVKQKILEGAVLVDSRNPSHFDEYHIDNSFNISVMSTPSVAMDELLNRVPVNSQIILICNSFVTCFDSEITGSELYQIGHQLLGYYKDIDQYEN